MSTQSQAPSSPRKAAIRSETDSKIANSLLEILRDEGFDAVTIENVANHSGVAKTTIYRRYKDRYEMMAKVSEHLSEEVLDEYPLTEAGLAELIAAVQKIFEDKVGLRAVGVLLTSAKSSLQDWSDRVVSPSLDALKKFFAVGVSTGELSASVDYDQIIEMIIGGMIVSDALRGDVPDEWGEELASLIWPVISAKSS